MSNQQIDNGSEITEALSEILRMATNQAPLLTEISNVIQSNSNNSNELQIETTPLAAKSSATPTPQPAQNQTFSQPIQASHIVNPGNLLSHQFKIGDSNCL